MYAKKLQIHISNWGINETRILRYAVGSILAFAIAMGFSWPLSYLVPVLILGFLKPKAETPTIKSAINFVLFLSVACGLGLIISQYLLPYPILHIILMTLLFLHLFYAEKSVINQDLKTWIMVATLMIPIMGLSSQELAFVVAVNILVGAMVTVGIGWVVYRLFPEPEMSVSVKAPSPVPMSAESRLSEAITGLLVVMPILALFYSFNWSNHALVLIFIAILASMPAISKSFSLGKAMVIGNLFGGIMAIILFEILVMIPHFYFLIWISFLAALYFGTGLFSEKKAAPLFGMAFSTLLVIIGSATSGTADAGDKVWIRVIQIAVAVIYVVLAYRFLDKWKESNLIKTEAAI